MKKRVGCAIALMLIYLGGFCARDLPQREHASDHDRTTWRIALSHQAHAAQGSVCGSSLSPPDIAYRFPLDGNGIDARGAASAEFSRGFSGLNPTTGFLNGALHFDGKDDHLRLGGRTITGDAGQTRAVWLRPGAMQDGDMIFSRFDIASGRGYYLRIANADAGIVEFVLSNSKTARDIVKSPPNTLRHGRWTHVAIAWKPGAQVRLYVDGVQQASAEHATAIPDNALDETLAGALGAELRFTGKLDDFVAYARALSASEVDQFVQSYACKRFLQKPRASIDGAANLASACRGLSGKAQRYCENAFMREEHARANDRAGRYLPKDNRGGRLGWENAFRRRAYAEMFEATRSSYWLSRLAEHNDKIVLARDDKVGARDYQNRSLAGWSTSRNNKKGREQDRERRVVHDGHILLPLMRYVELVQHDETIPPAYQSKVVEYLATTATVVASYEDEWRSGPDQLSRRGEGYFFSGGNTPSMRRAAAKPFNRQAVMGISLWHLSQHGGNPIHREKAIGIGRILLRHLQPKGSGYRWTFGFGEPFNRRPEDTSHGSLDVNFATALYRGGAVFGHGEIVRLANTFIDNVYVGAVSSTSPSFHYYVDGTDGKKKAGDESGGRWMELAVVDRRVMEIVEAVFSAKKWTTSVDDNPSRLLGVALLAKWANVYGE